MSIDSVVNTKTWICYDVTLTNNHAFSSGGGYHCKKKKKTLFLFV